MKQLVVCPPNFHLEYPKVLGNGSLIAFGDLVHYALIEGDMINFNPDIAVNEVLVQKKAFSCNYRDLALMKMVNSKLVQINKNNNDDIRYYSIGSEFSGIVVNIGNNVTKLKIGDRVIGDNNYPISKVKGLLPGLVTNHGSREFDAFHESKLIKIPSNMSFEVAAGFSIAAQTVFGMLEKLDIKENGKVLFTGITSNTSLFGLNVMKYKNVKLYGLSRKEIAIERFNHLRIDDVFVLNDDDVITNNERILDHIRQHGKFDYVIDPFGDVNFIKLLDLIKVEGKYITCGVSNQSTIKEVTLPFNQIIAKIIMNNISVIGNCLGTSQNLLDALSDYSKGLFQFSIDSIFDKNINEFMERSFLSKERLGKVIFVY
jgi:NADPH:quinone reductase-like Zn-dependent oxidoreductase